MYIPLHVHTSKGSIGDAILKIEEYIKKAQSYGLKHLAITNHASMADMYEFHDECKKNGINPIIGCEVYEVEDRTVKSVAKDDENDAAYWHLVLIAKNDTGLKNLLHITTDAQLNGFYYKPRTDLSVLREHGEGVIALTGCIAGKLPKVLAAIRAEHDSDRQFELRSKAHKIISEYKEVFDELYLEIQPGDFEEQIEVNKELVKLSQETGTPLIVTNDMHYLEADDWLAHDVHVKVHRKKKIEDAPVYPDKCYYFQTQSSISKSLSYLGNAVDIAIKNTEHIANQCSVNLKPIKLYMPHYGAGEYSEEDLLSKLSFEKLMEMVNDLEDPAGYTTRLLYELEVINELGFAGYFLTVRDFVTQAKIKKIPVGPGRGSVCGLT